MKKGAGINWHSDESWKYGATYYVNNRWNTQFGGELMFTSENGHGYIPVVGNSLVKVPLKDEIEYSNGVVKSKTDSALKMNLKEFADSNPFGPAVSTASVDLEEAGGGFAVHIVDLEIDEETGKTDVIDYTTIQDVGKAIHPSYVEGQMQGGAAQGIGWALNEEYFMSQDGIMLNSSYLDYRMPISLDLPMINTIMVEVPSEEHPFGVRGVGEPPICPPIPAIGNAIKNAIDIRLLDTPMKPSKIIEALKDK